MNIKISLWTALVGVVLFTGCASHSPVPRETFTLAVENAPERHDARPETLFAAQLDRRAAAKANRAAEDTARREAYLAAHPKLSKEKKERIAEGWFEIGMSGAEVRAAMGDPESNNKSVGAGWTHEQWIYGSRYLYFDNGILTSYQLPSR